MKPSPQYIVYLIGVIALGLAYDPVKAALGGQWLFVVAVLGYLVGLRLLGHWLARALAGRADR